MKYLLSITAVFILSCNTAMFVNKSRVIHEAQGYLLYYHSDKCLFIPNKDTSIGNFLKDTLTKKGYLLKSVCGIDGLKFVSKKLNVDMIYMDNKQEVRLPDSVYFTITRLRYLLNKTKDINFSDTVEFIYMGMKYKVDASDGFYGEALTVEGNAR
jgi:hypothetical protein